MTAKGMVMIQNKVVNTFKRLEYAASLLYTRTIWVIVEADGVMEARYTMSSKVLPSGLNTHYKQQNSRPDNEPDGREKV